LKELWLNDNPLSGSIPNEIVNLTNLERLDLRNTQLTGSIPPNFTRRLKEFYYNDQINSNSNSPDSISEQISEQNSEQNSKQNTEKNSKENSKQNSEQNSEQKSESKSDSKSISTKIILITICLIIVLLVLTVVVVYYRKLNNKKIGKRSNDNDPSSDNESNSDILEKNDPKDIVLDVENNDTNLETLSPSDKENSNINNVDNPNVKKTSKIPITTDITSIYLPSSNHNDLTKQSKQPQKPHQPQQLKLQLSQLENENQMEKKLHQLPPEPSSEQNFNEISKEQNKKQFQEQRQNQNMNQNSPISFPHNTVPLNATRIIPNNNNRENQDYPFTIDYDEPPPSYDEVINN